MHRTLCACAIAAALLAAAPGATQAAIPASLKTSCVNRTPHPGYSYRFCDDGLPNAGGVVANPGGVAAVTVPAKYNGFEGLPAKAADATSVPGADSNGDVALDVDISLPDLPAPPGGYPLLVFMHGCCAGSKASWEATSFDAGGELWHYNNAWFASRGYVVVNYTARGFVNGAANGDRGSTGETQLDSRLYEINDYQHLAGQIADDPFFNVDPQRVVTTGGSYGGGFSWLALTDPTWQSPGGRSMGLAAVAPKYGWTDLLYSLVPTGKHFQTPNAMPAFDGSDSTVPFGIPKKSILGVLYGSGAGGVPPPGPHTTFPPEITEALACLNSTDPYETNPLCAGPLATTLPAFIDDRSAYYQSGWFTRIASDPSARVPIFNAATFTDPLFTPVENLRMYNRIKQVRPDYPIQQYFGDYQHFVQNKAKEWGDMCGADHHVCQFADYAGGDLNATPTGHVRTGVTTRLNRFVDHYAQPPGNPAQPQPGFNVTASLQTCPQNASAQFPADEPGETFTAPSYRDLAPGTLELDMTGNQMTVSNAEPNPHAVSADPVGNLASNGGRCPVETQPAGPGVAVYQSAPLASTATMLGATTLTIDFSASTTNGLQLNSRLYDVFPDGRAVMVDRGVHRVDGGGPAFYQLHGNGWRFPAGHSVRIEIAQDDDPFLRASSIASSTTISHVHLSIPIREVPGYPRPKSATPVYAPLVTAHASCGSNNRQHAGPLSFSSCSPPAQTSSRLTSGTPDSNSQFSNFTGSVKLVTLLGNPATPADEADVRIDAVLGDVRNAGTLSDYTGELQAVLPVQLTDRNSGGDAATTQPFTFSLAVPCTATGDTTIGSSCAVHTTADAVAPGAISEGRRAVWELGAIEVRDGGADGLAATDPNAVFARQGVFVP
jgi:dienelactone hydrolase